MRELLRFAPPADFRGRAEERKIDRGWKRRSDRGYPEYCAAMLEELGAAAWRRSGARRELMALLDRPAGRKVFRLTDKGVAASRRRRSLAAGRPRRAGLLRDLAAHVSNARIRERQQRLALGGVLGVRVRLLRVLEHRRR